MSKPLHKAPANNNAVTIQLPVNQIIQLLLLTCLILLSYQIVEFFIKPMIWAAIIAFITLPLQHKLTQKMPNSPNLVSFLMLLGILILFFVPLSFGLVVLQRESGQFLLQFQQFLMSGKITIPAFIENIPTLGHAIKTFVTEVNLNPQLLMEKITAWVQTHLYYGRQIIDGISLNLARIGIMFIALFFFYRDHKVIMQNIYTALYYVVGKSTDNYLLSISTTTRAVVESIGLTALAQTTLASIAYFIISYFVPTLPSPVILTLITLVVAVIPFCMPFTWGFVSVWLFTNGHTVPALALALWGIFVISWVDNWVRTLVISSATEIPFLLIFFGVLGGIATFGLVGLFIGPVILAVALAVWREWLAEHPAQKNMPPSNE